jgi:hypothetical protein
MISLYFFSSGLEHVIGGFEFLIIYLGSLVGGNLLTLLIHKNHGDYSAVGASGAICGVIFASIALVPGLEIGLFILPLHIPGWIFGLVYVLASIYGIRSKSENIGHESHLGGGLIGMMIAILLHPSAVLINWFPIIMILVPSVVFMYFIIRKPGYLLVDNYFFRTHDNYTLEDRYNLTRRNKEQEIDRILEKIHKNGVKSLTRQEKEKLEAFSKSE